MADFYLLYLIGSPRANTTKLLNLALQDVPYDIGFSVTISLEPSRSKRRSKKTTVRRARRISAARPSGPTATVLGARSAFAPTSSATLASRRTTLTVSTQIYSRTSSTGWRGKPKNWSAPAKI